MTPKRLFICGYAFLLMTAVATVICLFVGIIDATWDRYLVHVLLFILVAHRLIEICTSNSGK